MIIIKIIIIITTNIISSKLTIIISIIINIIVICSFFRFSDSRFQRLYLEGQHIKLVVNTSRDHLLL